MSPSTTKAKFTQRHTVWGVGRHIVESAQGGAARVEYGAKLLLRLAEKFAEEFGRGFDVQSLEKMRQFYLAFPIADALRPQLNWTHSRTLMRVEDERARYAFTAKPQMSGCRGESTSLPREERHGQSVCMTGPSPALFTVGQFAAWFASSLGSHSPYSRPCCAGGDGRPAR